MKRRFGGAHVLLLSVLVVGCGSASDSASTDGEPDESVAAEVPGTDGRTIAFLSASSANTWLAAAEAEIERVGTENGIDVTTFDAQFDPAAQTAQLQDVIASGRYDGVILNAIDGEGIVTDVEAAVAAGLEVVVMDTIVGPVLTDIEPQVDGVTASIVTSPYKYGQRLGEVTIQACAGLDPCEVVYVYGIKGLPIDDVQRQGFDDTISAEPSISVVAEGEGQYLGPEQGIALTEDLLQTNDTFDVMVGSDQSMQGAAIVLAERDLLPGVKLIGVGGSVAAIDAISDGSWFGGVYGAPGNQGRLSMEALVAAFAGEPDFGGVDPVEGVADDGVMTGGNIAEFTAQWEG